MYGNAGKQRRLADRKAIEQWGETWRVNGKSGTTSSWKDGSFKRCREWRRARAVVKVHKRCKLGKTQHRLKGMETLPTRCTKP